MDRFREVLKLLYYYNDELLLDEERAQLLLLIKETGSILAASKILGIPYTRAWDYIARIERTLGFRIIEAKRGGRGGGGARLTEDGLRILNMYLRGYERVFNKSLKPARYEVKRIPKTIIYAGSDDILLKRILGVVRSKGYHIESYSIGSFKGYASLILGESDLAGIHILDLESGEYNIPFLKRSSAGMKLYLIRGYMRLQGFVTRDRLSYSEVLDGLRSGRLRFMNRNPGSGTRLLIDYVLGRELGNEFKEIKGYNDYVNSHLEVASKVAEGIADVGVCIEYCAKYYNLNFIPLKWEYFDFVTKDEIEKPVYQEIISILKSEEFRNKLKDFPGYKIASDTGKVIEIA